MIKLQHLLELSKAVGLKKWDFIGAGNEPHYLEVNGIGDDGVELRLIKGNSEDFNGETYYSKTLGTDCPFGFFVKDIRNVFNTNSNAYKFIKKIADDLEEYYGDLTYKQMGYELETRFNELEARFDTLVDELAAVTETSTEDNVASNIKAVVEKHRRQEATETDGETYIETHVIQNPEQPVDKGAQS